MEQSATETVEEPADSEETNDPFAEIPQVVLSKPVDYSLNQAIRQLEQMEAADERYAQIVENAEKYPEKLLINLANNPEMIAFVADYKGNTRDYDKAELTEKELQEEYPLFYSGINAGAALHMGMTAMSRSADAVRQHWRWQ